MMATSPRESGGDDPSEPRTASSSSTQSRSPPQSPAPIRDRVLSWLAKGKGRDGSPSSSLGLPTLGEQGAERPTAAELSLNGQERNTGSDDEVIANLPPLPPLPHNSEPSILSPASVVAHLPPGTQELENAEPAAFEAPNSTAVGDGTTEEVAERTGRRRSYKRSSSSSSESRRNRHQSSKQKSEAKSEIAGSGSSKKKESKREKRISKTFSISDIDEGDEAVVEPASPPNADLPLPMPSPKADNINTISSSDHMAWDELSKEVSQEAKESVKAEILSQLERELAMDIEHLEWIADAQRSVLKSATLGQFLSVVISRSLDSAFVHHVILSMQHFIPASRFLYALEASSRKASRGDNPADAMRSQLRVMNVLKTWFMSDFSGVEGDYDLNAEAQGFFAELKAGSPAFGEYIQNMIKAKQTKAKASSVSEHTTMKTAPPVIPPLTKKSSDDYTILDFDALEIARQLCLIDGRLLSEVKISEFHDTRWTKNQAPHILTSYDMVNKLTYYLGAQVVQQDNPKDQTKVITQIIKIGKNLADLQNYNSLLAVYLTFNLVPIHKIFESVKKDLSKSKVLKDYDRIMELMNTGNNFANYHRFASQIQAPYIPCYEIHLKDLLYQTEAQPNWADEANGIINFAKLDTMGKIISVFSQAQLESYNFATEPTIYQTISIPGFNVEELRAKMNSFLGEQSPDRGTSPTEDASVSEDLASDSTSTNIDREDGDSITRSHGEKPSSFSGIKSSIMTSLGDIFSSGSKSGKGKRDVEFTAGKTVERYTFLLFGDIGSGRTTLLNRMGNGDYLPVNRSKEDERIQDVSIAGAKVNLFNPMLQPETPLDAVSQLQYGWFDGIFLVYDVTVQDSLKNLILQVEKSSKRSIPMVLLGTRCDDTGSREVSNDQGSQFAYRMRIPFLEVSAKTGENITLALETLLASVRKHKLVHSTPAADDSGSRSLDNSEDLSSSEGKFEIHPSAHALVKISKKHSHLIGKSAHAASKGMTLRLVIVGLTGAGKTALMNRLVSNKFVPTKLSSVDENSAAIEAHGLKYELLVPVMQEEVALDTTLASKDPIDGLLCVYDVTDGDSFTHFSYWLERSALRTKVPCVMLANRVDEKGSREVSPDKGKSLAEKFEMPYFEVSAKTGENARTSLENLLTSIRVLRPHFILETETVSMSSSTPPSKSKTNKSIKSSGSSTNLVSPLGSSSPSTPQSTPVKGNKDSKESRKEAFKSSRHSNTSTSESSPPISRDSKAEKIVLVGLSGCGRTALMNRIVTGTFMVPKKSSVNETSPTIDINGLKIELVNPMTDEEQPLDSLDALKQTVNGLIFVFDVTDNDSFMQFSFWLERSKLRSTIPAILVASHSDEKSSREVSSEKAKALAEKFKLTLFEVSAKTGENIRPSIEALLAAIAASRCK